MQQDELIDNLRTVHEEHVRKLKEIHEAELAHLTAKIAASRQETADLRSEKEWLRGLVEELRDEVEGMRNDFDLIHGRLGKIIVEEDELVKMVELAVNAVEDDDECGTNLTNETDGTDVMRTVMKYLKKLQGSDPLHLCHLLEIPFNPPNRAFTLSSSLLTSISAHLSDDPATAATFKDNPVAVPLIRENIELRLEAYEMARCFLENSRRAGKLAVGGAVKEGKSVMRWLIDEHETVLKDSNDGIISSFLSNFK